MHGNVITINIQVSKQNFPSKSGSAVGTHFHIHLNQDDFQGYFH
jgi:hypothetical protein